MTKNSSVAEVTFNEICFLKSEVLSYKQQTDKMMGNFKNTDLLTELKVTIFLLGNENSDLRNQLIDKHMTIPKLESSKVSPTFKSTISPPTLTTITIDNNTAKTLTNSYLRKSLCQISCVKYEKKKHVKFIELKKHLEKHLDKENKLPSKKLSQPIVNLVKSSDSNNAEIIKK